LNASPEIDQPKKGSRLKEKFLFEILFYYQTASPCELLTDVFTTVERSESAIQLRLPVVC